MDFQASSAQRLGYGNGTFLFDSQADRNALAVEIHEDQVIIQWLAGTNDRCRRHWFTLHDYEVHVQFRQLVRQAAALSQKGLGTGDDARD